VDNILMAVAALALLTLVVEVLAEGEGDAAPAPVGVISLGTAVHTGLLVLGNRDELMESIHINSI
jgi:hypothetical protein